MNSFSQKIIYTNNNADLKIIYVSGIQIINIFWKPR